MPNFTQKNVLSTNLGVKSPNDIIPVIGTKRNPAYLYKKRRVVKNKNY